MKSHLLFILLLLASSLFSNTYTFRNYQMENGLSQNSVWSIIQDKDGFMWFGTKDGLNRFDGVNFKIFRKNNTDNSSLGNNFVRAIKEDSKGRFWIGTDQGLFIFNKETEKFKQIYFADLNDIKSEVTINYIFEDRKGNIWFATHGQGLLMLSASSDSFKHYNSNPSHQNSLPTNYLWSLAQDTNDLLWIGTVGAGLVQFDIENEQFTKDIIKNDIPNDQTIYGIYSDGDNNVWIGTSSKGLLSYNCRTGKVKVFLNEKSDEILNIRAITAFSDKEIIMGSDNGVVIFNIENSTYKVINNKTYSNNLSDKSIFCITKDREGSFWIGTYFGGVNYFSPSMNQFSYYCHIPNRNSLKGNIVSGFLESEDGSIWISTNDGGLSRFNPSDFSFQNFTAKESPKIRYDNIQSILLRKEHLWIGYYAKGIDVLNTSNGNINSYLHDPNKSNTLNDDNIFVIFESSKGEVLVGTPIGVNKFREKTNDFTPIDQLNNIYIKDIKEDVFGSIWFASNNNGLFKLSSNGSWKNYLNSSIDPYSISSNNINCIFFDSKRRLWIGTENGGICLYDYKKDQFKVFDESKGLPNNMVYAIVDDVDGNIWASTNSGLVQIDVETWQIKAFNHIEGIKKIHYNYKCALRSVDNKLYFGGTNGFTVFNPTSVKERNNIEPIVAVTGFQVFNKEIKAGSRILETNINLTQSINLKYNEATFSFDFAALSFIAPEHNQFEFILEGFEKDWNHVQSNQKAYYMNIPPGNYIFKIRASNGDMVWNQTEKSIHIHIEPPIWLSKFMIVFYILTIISLGWYLIRKNNKRIENKNSQKLEKYKTIKELETYESKIHFFTNIAHEIRTPLSLIIAPIEKIFNEYSITPEVRFNLEIVERNTNRLLELVNQLLDFRKMEEGMLSLEIKTQDIISVVRKAFNLYEKTAELNKLNMTLYSSSGIIMCTFDSEAVFKILNNLISNSLKYARSKIEIRVNVLDNFLRIEIEDDGIGIDSNHQEKIFEPFFQIENTVNKTKAGSGLGLSYAQSLAIKQNGKIEVKNVEMGTVFSLILPLSDYEIETLRSDYNIQEVDKIIDKDLTSIGKQKVLVVEDNVELRTFICDSLESLFITREAENGIEAIQVIENEIIDVIVSDIMMPEMDGVEFCRFVKTNPSHSHLPIILLSAKAEVKSKVEGLEIGADVYMEKPFSIEHLKAQITSIIENRNRLRQNFIKTPLLYLKQHPAEGNESLFIQKTNDAVIENLSNSEFNIDFLSRMFSMSRSNFHKKIKVITGMTPNDYINLIRLNQAALLLSSGKYKINEVCYKVGFNTPSYFTKCFYDQFGKLPKDYIQNI